MKSPTLGNRDLMRAINRSILLNAIKTYGPIARAELARRTGLSPATVTGITAELISEDLVFEKTLGNSSGGRPPILLCINPSGGHVVGIKLTEDELIGALTDLEANMIARGQVAITSHAVDHVVTEIVALVAALLDEARLPQTKLLGVGVGLAGIVDSRRGMLLTSPYLGWRDLPLRDRIQEKLQVPVYVDNDVNTLTQSEKWFGSGQGVDNFIVLTVGRGIGMGLVINGQFYRGANGGAGEFGHTVVQPAGRLCTCGRYGCIETIASEPGLLCTANEMALTGKLPKVDRLDDLLALAQAGNAEAVRIFSEAGNLLGCSIGNLVNVLNPQMIILGGEGVRMGPVFFEPLCEAVRHTAIPTLLADLTIKIEPWGDDAWARGAASLALRELFESPVHREVIAMN